MLKVSTKDFSPKQLLDSESSFWDTWSKIFEDDPTYASFFTHKETVKSWLSTLPEDSRLKASFLHIDNDVVGVMLLGVGTRKILRYFTVTALRPLRTGIETDDQWWPEYVSPICKPIAELHKSWWLSETLKQAKANLFEFEAYPLSWFDKINDNNDDRFLKLHLEKKEPGGKIDLKKDLKWPKSTKRQINQTNNFAKRNMDEIKLVEIILNKNKFVKRHSDWHIKKWEDTNTPSGFKNPQFIQMLNNILMNQKAAKGRVFAAIAKDRCVGVQVIFQHKKWAGFYLASLHPEEKNNHWHIGTWLHTQIAEKLKLEGVEVYDFMAGESGYKKRLSTDVPEYCKAFCFRNNNIKMRILKKLL